MQLEGGISSRSGIDRDQDGTPCSRQTDQLHEQLRLQMSPDRHERAASAGGRARARRSPLLLRNGALPGLWPASFHQSIEPQVVRGKKEKTAAMSLPPSTPPSG